ncbi:MAG TPA: S1/P1 nuclease [Cyclobacteriaceae bacterium]|nr:S1/P1 nuclease [Cyclobacteriaceae bacterium]
MKKPFLLLLLLCLILTQSFGWGATGHRVTGYIAEQYLNAKAKKRLAAILGQESLAMASTWMDEIRSDSTYNYTTDWHWTTVPDGKRYEDVEQNVDGKIVMMIEKISKELGTGKLPPKQELEYLRMLVHLVGDVHQPLHVGKPGDKGANDVKVTWFGANSNLHRVWDSEMIDDSKLSFTELAQFIPKPDGAAVKRLQSTSVRDWVLESMSFRPQVYDIGDGKLGYRYTYKYFGIVKTRLMQAGVRLAGLLNSIYGK